MELIFNGKRSRSEIINEANLIDNPIENTESSILFYGDNFIGMSRLLKKFKNKIDLVYIDPPFNTEQIFSIGETRISTISRSKKGKVAYADIMSPDVFLNNMYERFVLIHELLSDKGSLYVHIDLKMGHYFKIILDEIFGVDSFRNDITRIKSNPKNFDRKAYGNEKDMILFYTKTNKNIWNNERIKCTDDELKKMFGKIDKNGRRYTTIPLHAPGETNGITGKPWRGMNPPEGRHWRTNPEEFDRLDKLGLIEWSSKGNPRIMKYADEHKGKKVQDIWEYKDPQYPLYPTEKNLSMLEFIVKQSSNEDSYVMDCFAGSGSTLLAAVNNKRRFIGMDKSQESIKVINKRLSNITYDIYKE